MDVKAEPAANGPATPADRNDPTPAATNNGTGSTESNEGSGSGAADDTVVILDVSHDPLQRQQFIAEERKRVIQLLAQKSVNGLDQSSPQIKALLERLNLFVTWMEVDLQMTKAIKERTAIDKGLQLMFHYPKYKFPAEFQARAKALYDRWEGEIWGANAVDEDENAMDTGEDEEDQQGVGLPRRTGTRENVPPTETVRSVRLPPPGHSIWGVNGIMHGVALSSGARRAYILDPRYSRKKGNPKVFGANGFKSGDWFPLQLVALFKGVHGSAMAGISGDRELGAYSIVVAGMYDDLDTDDGETLLYSGSGSHDNKNQHEAAPPTNATLALHASLRYDRPVRVLRSHSGRSRYAPTDGLRYDGIYKVVELRHPRNANNGLYEQFKLVRCPGQPPIAAGGRPTATELRQLNLAKRGY